MSDMQKIAETKNAYDQILQEGSLLADTEFDYKYYQDQCVIREEEKKQNRIPLFGGVCFDAIYSAVPMAFSGH